MFCKGKSVQAASFHIYLQVEVSYSGLSFTELKKKKRKKECEHKTGELHILSKKCLTYKYCKTPI